MQTSKIFLSKFHKNNLTYANQEPLHMLTLISEITFEKHEFRKLHFQHLLYSRDWKCWHCFSRNSKAARYLHPACYEKHAGYHFKSNPQDTTFPRCPANGAQDLLKMHKIHWFSSQLLQTSTLLSRLLAADAIWILFSPITCNQKLFTLEGWAAGCTSLQGS